MAWPRKGGAPKPGKVAGLKIHAAHGVKSNTRHGPGGMRSHGIKIPKVPTLHTKMAKTHTTGQVKIPRIHAPRPGKGTHNHVKKVP
jgi:hypothetical protein